MAKTILEHAPGRLVDAYGNALVRVGGQLLALPENGLSPGLDACLLVSPYMFRIANEACYHSFKQEVLHKYGHGSEPLVHLE